MNRQRLTYKEVVELVERMMMPPGIRIEVSNHELIDRDSGGYLDYGDGRYLLLKYHMVVIGDPDYPEPNVMWPERRWSDIRELFHINPPDRHLDKGSRIMAKSGCYDMAELIWTIKHDIQEIILHEYMEFFRIEGLQLWNPHSEHDLHDRTDDVIRVWRSRHRFNQGTTSELAADHQPPREDPAVRDGGDG